MKTAALLVLLLVSNVRLLAQSSQTSLLVTRIFGIGPEWPGECQPGVFNNQSSVSRQLDYISVYATGSGSWSVALNYSDSSCTGPWTSFGFPSQITNLSNPPIAYAVGFHNFVQILITGSATVTLSGTKNFFLASTVSTAGVVDSFTGAQGSTRSGAVQAVWGDYTALMVSPVQLSITYSASPTFDLSTCNICTITLNGDANPTFINAFPGIPYTITVCQDSAGFHLFNWPAGVTGAMIVGTQPLKCSVQDFKPTTATTLQAKGPGIVNQ